MPKAYNNQTSSIGTIQSHGGPLAPSGYFICDGSAVSRTVYANLFAILGDSWGEGDGSTTFNVPDLRGLFVRGLDLTGGTRDPDVFTRVAWYAGGSTGMNVGSYQGHEFASHQHGVYPLGLYGGGVGLNDGGHNSSGYLSTGATGGSETRPINAYVNYIIKF